MQDFQSVQEFRPTKTVQEVLVQGSAIRAIPSPFFFQRCDEVKTPGLCAYPGLALVSLHTQDWVAKVTMVACQEDC